MRYAGLVVLVLIGLGQTTGAKLNPDWSVVLTEEQAKPFWKPRLCSRPGPGAIEQAWTPDLDTIRRLEVALAPALDEAIRRIASAPGRPTPDQYYRQYAGYVAGGRRRIYVSGLHKRAIDMLRIKDSWREDAMVPCDGGMLFFGAEYDVETRAVSHIEFQNGGRRLPQASSFGWIAVF